MGPQQVPESRVWRTTEVTTGICLWLPAGMGAPAPPIPVPGGGACTTLPDPKTSSPHPPRWADSGWYANSVATAVLLLHSRCMRSMRAPAGCTTAGRERSDGAQRLRGVLLHVRMQHGRDEGTRGTSACVACVPPRPCGATRSATEWREHARERCMLSPRSKRRRGSVACAGCSAHPRGRPSAFRSRTPCGRASPPPPRPSAGHQIAPKKRPTAGNACHACIPRWCAAAVHAHGVGVNTTTP